jgi:lipid-A-disaccharide synthase
MARFVDRLLAILPFEPDVHRRLGGPPTTYVGHPLIERLGLLRPAPGERSLLGGRPTLLVLPGSRRSETSRLLPVFGETAALAVARHGPVELVVPAVPWLADDIRRGVETWPVKPTIVVGEAEKFAALRRAHAALAASGTVTLELALAGVPMVIAYRSDWLAKVLRPAIESQWSLPLRAFGLSNLILGAKASPEFLNRETTPEAMSTALVALLSDTPERRAQEAAFASLDRLMALDGATPSGLAADIVVETARARARA